MSELDLSFVADARALEVDAVEGGRALNEFTNDPQTSLNPEELPIMGRSVDDAEETAERLKLVQQYLGYAWKAYEQRGLVYPFRPSAAGDSFEILPGQHRLARRAAQLSAMVSRGNPVAKSFEQTAFCALHTLVGGSGSCLGAPRNDGMGAQVAIERFRESLMTWEKGDKWPADFAKNGDHGADGFIVLGRSWGGPVLFYQAKNTNFDLKDHPKEFARLPEILHDWFGKRWNQWRWVIPVLATNTVLTLEMKDRIFEARGTDGTHLIDAVDIVCAEFTDSDHACRRHDCSVY